MDAILGKVLQKNFCYYTSNICPNDLMTPMVQLNILSIEQMTNILEQGKGLEHNSKLLIGHIVQKATADEFVEILKFKGIHSFVAEEFERHRNDAIHDQLPIVQTIKVNTRRTRLMKVKKYALGLKKLIHSGFQEDFNIATKTVHDNWNRLWSTNDTKPASIVTEAADQFFYTLDAQIENLRVRFDPNIYKHQYFSLMEEVIKYTSEPQVSSMMYLARYGSAVSNQESLESGMNHISVAIQHSESVSPCKETGMVYYIEINMLFRKYHTESNMSIKRELLNKTTLAISHFETEDAAIKEEYTRMLLLKQVYVYLGLGVHGEEIQRRVEEPGDLQSARNCLMKIKENEPLLDKRRLMFLYIAESIVSERSQDVDRALRSAKSARDMASEGEFFRELSSINEHIKRMERTNTQRRDDMRRAAFMDMDEVLPGFSKIRGAT